MIPTPRSFRLLPGKWQSPGPHKMKRAGAALGPGHLKCSRPYFTRTQLRDGDPSPRSPGRSPGRSLSPRAQQTPGATASASASPGGAPTGEAPLRPAKARPCHWPLPLPGPSPVTPCLGPDAATPGSGPDQCPRVSAEKPLGRAETARVLGPGSFLRSPVTDAVLGLSSRASRARLRGTASDDGRAPGRRILGAMEPARPGGGELGRRGRAEAGGGRRLPGLRAIGRRARRQEGARERGPTPRPAEPIAGSAERG